LPSAGWTEIEARTLDELAPWYAERARVICCAPTSIATACWPVSISICIDIWRDSVRQLGGAGIRRRAFAG
jgi:hypothetical protein